MASSRTRMSPEDVAASRQTARTRMRAALHPDVVAAREGSGEMPDLPAGSGQDEPAQGAGDLTGQYPAAPAPPNPNEDAYARLAALVQMSGAQQEQPQPEGEQGMPMVAGLEQMMRGQ